MMAVPHKLDANMSRDELLVELEALRARVEALQASGQDSRISTRRTEVEQSSSGG